MNEWERLHNLAFRLRKQYPKGTKVRLNHMDGEPQMPSGLEGTVVGVDDAAQVMVNWSNGSTLSLNTEVDSFQVINRPEKKRDTPSR